MNEVEAVLEGFAEATRVPADEVAEHVALRNRVADALADVPAAGSGAGGRAPAVLRVVDAGAFRHGTAVRGASRFDVFVVLAGGKPKSLARVLEGIRSTVQAAVPQVAMEVTPDSVLIDSPTSETASGEPAGVGVTRLRLIAAFEAPDDAGSAIVSVPDAAHRWVLNRPGAREQLIERIDDGHLRALIRLVLVWKYVNSVPVSSYYLETAVIRQALQQPSFNLLWDLCWVLEQASHDDLMNLPDLSSPSQVQKVRAADMLGRRIEAQVPLDQAAANVRAAVNAYLDDDRAAVDARLIALFGPEFERFSA